MNRKTQQIKKPNVSLSAEKPEEADYVNAAVCTVDKMPAITDKKSPSFTRSVPTIAVSWVILFVIMALGIYFTSVISENNNKLTAENQILKTQTTQLETRIQNLTTQKQELETQRNNLTEQIQNMETNWNEHNISRAQWSIDAYCPKNNNNARVCAACQRGWLIFQTSCYVIVNPDAVSQITWEEAVEDCRRKNSDLVVTVDEAEKKYISDHSWESSGTSGYWIGLRVEDGKWKWVDGSELTKSSWIQTPANGQCAISVQNQGWKSVSCGDRNRWICEKAALALT